MVLINSMLGGVLALVVVLVVGGPLAAACALGMLPELAFALLGHGRTLVALGRPGEARPAHARARAILGDLQAGLALREVDTMLETMDARPAEAAGT